METKWNENESQSMPKPNELRQDNENGEIEEKNVEKNNEKSQLNTKENDLMFFFFFYLRFRYVFPVLSFYIISFFFSSIRNWRFLWTCNNGIRNEEKRELRMNGW